MIQRIVETLRAAGAVGPIALYTVAMPAISVPILAATQQSWYPQLVEAGGAIAPWYVLGGAILAGLSLVPTHAVSLVAGLLFGSAVGSVVALISVMLGAALGYGVFRPLAAPRALTGLAARPRAAAVHRALVRSGARQTIGLIVLVRLSPIMPFAGTNLLMAGAGVSWREFLLGSGIGLAPRVIAVAVVGAGLAELDFSSSLGRSWLIAGLIATIAAVVIIGRAAKRVLDRELDRNAVPHPDRGTGVG